MIGAGAWLLLLCVLCLPAQGTGAVKLLPFPQHCYSPCRLLHCSCSSGVASSTAALAGSGAAVATLISVSSGSSSLLSSILAQRSYPTVAAIWHGIIDVAGSAAASPLHMLRAPSPQVSMGEKVIAVLWVCYHHEPAFDTTRPVLCVTMLPTHCPLLALCVCHTGIWQHVGPAHNAGSCEQQQQRE